MSIQELATIFLKERDSKSFGELIKRLNPGLTSFAFNFVKDHEKAREVVSQVFVNVWEKIDQYKPEFMFSTWIYGITKNEALGQLRIEKRQISRDMLIENNSTLLSEKEEVFNMDDECIAPSGENLIEHLHNLAVIEIKSLSEPYRTVLYEREVEKNQLQDIAVKLGWNLNTVKTRLRKARKDVSNNLNKKYPELIESYYEETSSF
jgi:RNA polymerase sigma factor (sigma-70 family)